MQKWEYLILTREYEKSVNHPCIVSVNGKSLAEGGSFLSSPKYPSAWDFLNQVGNDGWELIGIDQANYVLKRPKQN